VCKGDMQRHAKMKPTVYHLQIRPRRYSERKTMPRRPAGLPYTSLCLDGAAGCASVAHPLDSDEMSGIACPVPVGLPYPALCLCLWS